MQRISTTQSQGPVSIDLVRAALRSEELADIPQSELEQASEDYERFLMLVQQHPNEALTPTKAIDEMWHLHMLHPVAYVADTVRLFGEILDHDGGFGATAEEAPILAMTFAKTSALWEEAFGLPYLGHAVRCTRNCVSRCTRKCKTINGRATSVPAFVGA